jgi:glycosyltransferase involved in cell wall biosynthesis
MLSIFTVTHDPTWMEECYESLRVQTRSDWEWVIIATEGTIHPIEEATKDDSRVTFIMAPRGLTDVGALKKLAVERCKGDAFVELDHDDMLASQAIEQLSNAFARGADFVYSDFIELMPEDHTQVYDPARGWEFYSSLIDGKIYQVVKSFEAEPCSLHAGWCSPFHVRAWSRACYDKVGGFNPNLRMAESYDLVCRTYLAGYELTHIEQGLYFHRLHGANRSLQFETELEYYHDQVALQHVYPIIYEWCRRNGHRIAHCGFLDETTRSMIDPGLLDHFPLAVMMTQVKEGTGCVQTYDRLNMLPKNKVVESFNFVYDKLVPKGWFVSKTPSTVGQGGFMNPTAQSYWNENSFWYWTSPHYREQLPHNKAPFHGARVWTASLTPAHEKNDIRHVHADLVALKGERVPGYNIKGEVT